MQFPPLNKVDSTSQERRTEVVTELISKQTQQTEESELSDSPVCLPPSYIPCPVRSSLTSTFETEVPIPQRLENPAKCYGINRVSLVENQYQLMLRLPTVFPDGKIRSLNVLVDTGCEANLINVNLCPIQHVHAPKETLKLIAANGERMNGGNLAINLNMLFVQEESGIEREELLEIPATFYLAELRVDAILSYPWMQENRLGVFPDLGALALRDPMVLLKGEQPKKRS